MRLVGLLILLLVSCAPSTAAPATPRLVNVYVTSAAEPRTEDLYRCAPAPIVIGLSGPASAELTMRLGEPTPLLTPAYQVGSDDLLIVNHPQTGTGTLKLEQVQALFSGRITNWKDIGGNDLPVQAWTFAAGEDVQQLFDRLVMHGQPVTTQARLAASAQGMSDSVGGVLGSIGYLPRRWKAGNTREALNVATVPVLVVARAEPQGPVLQLIACLQSTK